MYSSVRCEKMFRVSIGNLADSVSEGTLRGLFEARNLAVGNILLKKDGALVDCPDQTSCDKAVEALHGYELEGSVMQVEASMARRSGRNKVSNKIQIKNLPSHLSKLDVENLVREAAGDALKYEEAGAEGAVYVTFDSPEQAQSAVNNLNNRDFHGVTLKVDLASNKTTRRNRTNTTNSTSGMNRQELPLRIVVGSEYVGAIIGKQGQTIRSITSSSRARVDIHRQDNHSPETLVTIKGSPDSCTKACYEIMKVVQEEAQSLKKGDVPLKILCPNALCGRIIGKRGNVIKSFMEKSGTHVVVSSAGDANNFYVDRVITVTGTYEEVSKAEELISEKMRQCYEQDSQSFGMGSTAAPYSQQQMMYGPSPLPMMPGMNSYPGMRPPYSPYMQQQGSTFYPGMFGAGGPLPTPPQQQLEVTYLYVPDPSVGAVIGSKGANIKSVMRVSGARIKIMQNNKNEGGNGDAKKTQGSERKVIITGTPEAQWKAQFYIFEKIRAEGYFGNDEVHLRSEILVPKASVGRIIGKGGQNVKEMQRVSGAIVKLPENQGDAEEIPVTIIGHFYAIQSAQRRIRALLSSTSSTLPPSTTPPRKTRNAPQQNGN